MTSISPVDQQRLQTIVSQIATALLEGQTVSSISAYYNLEMAVAQELIDSPMVAEAVGRARYENTKRAAILVKGWSGLEELCLTDMIEQVQNEEQSLSDLVKVSKLAIEAQNRGLKSDGNGMVINNNNSVTLELGGNGFKRERQVFNPVKVESVLNQAGVHSLFEQRDNSEL